MSEMVAESQVMVMDELTFQVGAKMLWKRMVSFDGFQSKEFVIQEIHKLLATCDISRNEF